MREKSSSFLRIEVDLAENPQKCPPGEGTHHFWGDFQNLKSYKKKTSYTTLKGLSKTRFVFCSIMNGETQKNVKKHPKTGKKRVFFGTFFPAFTCRFELSTKISKSRFFLSCRKRSKTRFFRFFVKKGRCTTIKGLSEKHEISAKISPMQINLVQASIDRRHVFTV